MASLFFVAAFLAAPALASPYGGASYGQCQYGGCTTGNAGQPTKPSVTQAVGSLVQRLARAISAAAQAAGRALNRALQQLKHAITHTPPAVARAFPYFLFVALLIITAQLAFQTIRELALIGHGRKIAERERALSEDKDNFVMLVSHYMRTPLTYIRLGIESGGTYYGELETAVKRLGGSIEGLLARVTARSAAIPLTATKLAPTPKAVLTSPYFLAPVVAVGLVAAFADYLFIFVGDIQIPVIHLLFEAVVFVAVVASLYLVYRNQRIRRWERESIDQVARERMALNQTKDLYITQAGQAIRDQLTTVEAILSNLPPARGRTTALDGWKQLDALVYKFDLLGSLDRTTMGRFEQFSLQELLSEVAEQLREQMTSRHISLKTGNQTDIGVHQNRRLVAFVVSSALDNAIKFSPEGSSVVVGYQPSRQIVDITIDDQGQGIPEEYRQHLFEAFSRAGSVVTFDHPGLGLSLYLDKIIMEYLGGRIAVDAGSSGTRVEIGLPLAPAL